MSELAKVVEITLDRTNVFDHYIVMKDKNGALLARLKTSPNKSWEMFKTINKKWNKVKDQK